MLIAVKTSGMSVLSSMTYFYDTLFLHLNNDETVKFLPFLRLIKCMKVTNKWIVLVFCIMHLLLTYV